MRNRSDDPYQIGNVIEYNDEEELSDLMHFDKMQHKPKPREHGFRMGTIGKVKKMEEGEDVGSIADMNDQKVRDMAIEKFAAQIKKIVSAKLLGKQINVKLKGNKRLVAQITLMIKMEVEYLKALMNGQDSKSPALQKNKELLKAEANKLDRMLQTDDFWPFK